MTDAADLATTAARWVTLRADEATGPPVVAVLDAAAATAAPFRTHPYQLAVGVRLRSPAPDGQPGQDEHAELRAHEQALVDALAATARLVASVTVDGVRELLFYASDLAGVQAWEGALPDGLGGFGMDVRAVEDPQWKGLRELAGLLGPGEEPLVLLD